MPLYIIKVTVTHKYIHFISSSSHFDLKFSKLCVGKFQEIAMISEVSGRKQDPTKTYIGLYIYKCILYILYELISIGWNSSKKQF